MRLTREQLERVENFARMRAPSTVRLRLADLQQHFALIAEQLLRDEQPADECLLGLLFPVADAIVWHDEETLEAASLRLSELRRCLPDEPGWEEWQGRLDAARALVRLACFSLDDC